jgi:autotransporter-associated beta strand protein
LTFTGTNTYSGATNLSAGTIEVYDGTLTTSGGAVNMVSNTSISVLGGAVNSTWNVGGEFGSNGNNYNNAQVLIDGDGVAGSARVIGVSNLIWGRTASNSTLTLTDGGQMSVTGEVRIGNPYYNTNGNSNITIGGGTATSTFSGDGGDDFYIGYGERRGSNNNVVTVSSGGVLTNIRDMFVGHVNNGQNASTLTPSTANKLSVTGTGTASMRGISVGYAQNAGIVTQLADANANVVEVTSGGTLTTSGVSYIGRANNNFTQSNSNTLTVTGTDSSWAAGNQNVFVGFTTSTSATSNNNILTVGVGGTVTGINGLTVGSGSGTETGNQLVVNGSLTATTVTVNAGNTLSGSGTINGAATISGILSPGASPGVLAFGSSLALTITAETIMEIDGAAANDAGVRGTDFDGVDVTGALTYAGALTLVFGTTFDDGIYSFNLFDMASETGEFSVVTLEGVYNESLVFDGTDAWELEEGDNTWTFTQSDGILSLTVVPETSTTLLGVLGALALLRRRRK